MSLDFNLAVPIAREGRSVFFKEAEDDDESALKPLTESIILSSIAVGIREVSNSNVEEWLFRYEAWSIANGLFILREHDSETAGTQYRNPNLREMRLHIGLTTNVRSINRGAFMKKISEEVAWRASRYVTARIAALETPQ